MIGVKFTGKRAIIILYLVALAFTTNAQLGKIDETFNSADSGLGQGDGANSYINTSALHTDGKLYIAGSFSIYNGRYVNKIARLNADGNLDPTFNNDTRINDDIITISIQNDGKAIIGGKFTNINGKARNRIARLNEDGTLDETFNPGTGANQYINTTAIQSDGKVIIGGMFTEYNGTSKKYIARLNTDGTLDASFGSGTGANSFVYTTRIQNDGKIIVGGNFSQFNGIENKRIIRLNSDGTLDETFKSALIVNNYVATTATQDDGKIIVGGGFTNGITRLNSDGTIDISFKSDSRANSSVSSCIIQNNDKIIIVGNFTNYNGTVINRVARLNNDGTLDETFKPDKIGANLQIKTASLLSNGKIIIGGDFNTYNETSINYIARLNVDGMIDETFNSKTGVNGIVYSTSIQNDGKIIIGGNFNSYNSILTNNIVRVNTDGSLDSNFNMGSGASTIIPGTIAGSVISTTSIQSDGKIIIAGNFNNYNGIAVNNIARLNTDGTLDATFNPGSGTVGGIISTSIQHDGKIIIVGGFSKYNGTARSCIARLNIDGTLDTSFDTAIGADQAVATSTIQNDGKILIGGYFSVYKGVYKPHIIRLNIDGTLDLSFNTLNAIKFEVLSIAIQSDGKILIGGYYLSSSGGTENCIARLNIDGTLDTSFNPVAGKKDVYKILLKNNGKIIIAGRFSNSKNILGLNSDGSLDDSFNPEDGANNIIQTMAMQSDEKIIIGGWFTSYYGIGRNRIARILGNNIATSTFDPRPKIDETHVWPNPTTGLLFIENRLIGKKYTIYDMTGTEIMNGTTDHNMIDLTKLKASIYFIMLDTTSYKIIKK